MKVVKKEVEFLLCELCEMEVEIYDPSRGDWYRGQYACCGCGRIICGNCDIGGEFSYRARRVRMCNDCLASLSVKELINQLKAK